MLKAHKSSYKKGEPLLLEASLRNQDQAPVTVLRRASHVDLGLDAYNANREFITSLLPPAPPLPPTKDDLGQVPAGGALLLGNWELLQRINQQIEEGNGRNGQFTVKATYHVGVGLTEMLKELDPAVWTGELTSNEVVVRYGP